MKSIAILTLIGLIGASIAIIVMYPFPTLAMHDSNLGVNTWLASDNSTAAPTTGEEAATEGEALEGAVTEGGAPIRPGLIEGNKSEPMRWLTYDDPILQFSIEYPSTWDISESKDEISFDIPDPDLNTYAYESLDVRVEPILTLDPSEYARDKLNEEREHGLEVIGLNETTINGQPAYRAQYNTSGAMELSYFMVTDDYTGYRLIYRIAAGDEYIHDEFTRYMPEIERMVNSFQITK